MFLIDSKEFQQLYDLLEVWAKKNGVAKPSNQQMGDMIVNNFYKYVQEEHGELAEMVEKDGTIYEGVVEDWNDNGSSDEE